MREMFAFVRDQERQGVPGRGHGDVHQLAGLPQRLMQTPRDLLRQGAQMRPGQGQQGVPIGNEGIEIPRAGAQSEIGCESAWEWRGLSAPYVERFALGVEE